MDHREQVVRRHSISAIRGFGTAIGCLLALAARPEAHAQIQAFAGRPFGVARVTAPIDSNAVADPARDDRFVVQEANGRAFYPAVAVNPVRRVFRRLLQVDSPGQVTVYFLFTGDEPLDITFHSPNARTLRAPVRHDERGFRRLLAAWWREYGAQARLTVRSDEYPPLVENYLVSMLAGRMGLEPPPFQRRQADRSQINEAVGMLLGAEAVRSAVQNQVLAQSGVEAGLADQPLPPPVGLPESLFPPAAEGIEIEPIAMHVPEECLYVRFGTFSNFLWLRDFMDQWGGNLQNMIAVRGVDTQANQRIEQQLSLRESSLSKILGPTVIADVAILAGDTAFEDGPSVGLLFQARNNFALSTDLTRQRREAVSGPLAASEQTVKIAGRDVSFISTPDNRVRSFYAADGDFHLVTTSRSMVERFLAAGAGERSLGASAEFRHARSIMPATNEDLIFAYLSDAFFRQALSPRYQIEMMRRMRSASQMQTVRLAVSAAAGEGLEFTEQEEAPAEGKLPLDDRIPRRCEQLAAAGFLPPGFANRADGSRLRTGPDGKLVDSLRGARGSFLPVGDVAIESVTASEAAAYQRFARQYQTDWLQAPTIAAAIRKESINGEGLEQLTLDLRVSPVSAPRYARYLGALGPPSKSRLARVEGDVASAELILNMALPLWSDNREVHHVFGGLRDFRMPFVVSQGNVQAPGGRPMFVRGYIGAWPRIGLLELFIRPSPNQPDAQGYAELPEGQGWQRNLAPMTVFSFKRDVLEEVTPQLRIVDAERPAQARVRIADLSATELSGAINAFGYKRAHETTTGGARFLNTLARQLHVAPKACREIAEELLNGKLICALGADYELVKQQAGLELWTSSALQPDNRFLLRRIPPDYQFPLLEWFRGLETELRFADETLSAHATILIQQKQPPADDGGGFQAPKFPGFGE